MDNGHYHPTEVVSDKISSMLLFFPKLALHVTRPVRWDSDHVVLFDDETKEIAKEIVRNDALNLSLLHIYTRRRRMEQTKMKFWKMLFLGSISFWIFTARTVLVQASVENVAAPLKTVWINSIKTVSYTHLVAMELPMSVFLIDSYMQGISIDMEEAAAIDGAGLLKTMFIIMMPLCKPILSTVVILTFMHVWNEFAFAQVLISQESLKTIPIGLTYFTSQYMTSYTCLLYTSRCV